MKRLVHTRCFMQTHALLCVSVCVHDLCCTAQFLCIYYDWWVMSNVMLSDMTPTDRPSLLYFSIQ